MRVPKAEVQELVRHVPNIEMQVVETVVELPLIQIARKSCGTCRSSSGGGCAARAQARGASRREGRRGYTDRVCREDRRGAACPRPGNRVARA